MVMSKSAFACLSAGRPAFGTSTDSLAFEGAIVRRSRNGRAPSPGSSRPPRARRASRRRLMARATARRSRPLSCALLIAGLIGIAIVLFQAPIRRAFLWFLGGSPAVQAAATEYYDWRIWAAPAGLANAALLGWFIAMPRKRWSDRPSAQETGRVSISPCGSPSSRARRLRQQRRPAARR